MSLRTGPNNVLSGFLWAFLSIVIVAITLLFGLYELAKWMHKHMAHYPIIADAINYAIAGLVMWLNWV
jgi:hypothetical protein